MDTDRPLRVQAAMVGALFLLYVLAAAGTDSTVSRERTEVGGSSAFVDQAASQRTGHDSLLSLPPR